MLNIPSTARLEAVGRHSDRYIWFISSVAALGGLLFGYDWVVIGGAKPFYESYFRLTSAALIGWANSCALIGCLLGSIVSGVLSDGLGRRKVLLLSALLFTVSSLYTGWACGFSIFVVWRIMGGVAIGMASNVSPTYIAEVSPAAWRGQLVTLNQLAVVVGILVAQIVNWLIARPVPPGASSEMLRLSWNGQWGWRWMFVAVAGPAIALFLCAWFIPESPRWLAKNGDTEGAQRTLVRIGGEAYGARALQEICASLKTEVYADATWREVLTPNVLTLLATGIGLAVLQQWAGINVIFSYAPEIYRSAGYGVSGVLFNMVVTGAINLLFTLIALGLVDRVGRRALMLCGCASIALSHTALGLAYAVGLHGLPVLLLTLSTIGCFAMSLAPVTWVLISEIFPTRIRGVAVAICVSALWMACFTATFTFPVMQERLGPVATFWTYGAICVAGFLFVLWRVPETKGKTLEEIERQLITPVARFTRDREKPR